MNFDLIKVLNCTCAKSVLQRKRERESKYAKNDEIAAERSRKMSNGLRKAVTQDERVRFICCCYRHVTVSHSQCDDDSCFFRGSWKIKCVGLLSSLSLHLHLSWVVRMQSENCVGKYLQNSSVVAARCHCISE